MIATEAHSGLHVHTPAGRTVLDDDTLYLGDNGRCLCGAHCGDTARTTGRDLSGESVLAVTPDVLAECRDAGFTPKCENCGKTASPLWTP